MSEIEKATQPAEAVARLYEALEEPLEELVRYCNNDDMLSNASEVIAAEAALETLYRARKAVPAPASASEPLQAMADNERELGLDYGLGASVAGAGEALAELVALKDMKDRFASTDYSAADPESFDAARAEYARRKPLAWAAIAEHKKTHPIARWTGMGEQHDQ